MSAGNKKIKETELWLKTIKTIGIIAGIFFALICIGMGIVSFFVDIEAELWLALIICSAILLLAIIICLTIITVVCLKNKTKTEELKSQKSNANEMLNAYQTIFGDKKCEHCDLDKQGNKKKKGRTNG